MLRAAVEAWSPWCPQPPWPPPRRRAAIHAPGPSLRRRSAPTEAPMVTCSQKLDPYTLHPRATNITTTVRAHAPKQNDSRQDL